MKTLIVTLLVTLSFVAQAGVRDARELIQMAKKAEPAPRDRDDRSGNPRGDDTPGGREETYEGNERDGGYYDGGGYDDGSEGGMIGELFRTAPQGGTVMTTTEDRGSVVVYTTTRQAAGDVCEYITVQVIEKRTGRILASDSLNTCEKPIL